MNRKPKRRGNDRGSALLVSLMVMVGLSLLGLGFVAISETENVISVNERNKTQTVAVAEAGANAVVQMFQDPATMEARGLLPPNNDAFKTLRTVNAYKGYYKPLPDRLFDTPFGPKEWDMFYGNEENADIKIVATGDPTNAADVYLETLNSSLFYSEDPTKPEKTGADSGKIVAIRVYAPPNVGGVLVNGFWVAGQRYGVATVSVVAEKKNLSGNVVAQSICRLVLAPFPLPGPSGAIQAIGTIATNGAYEVHWGAIESEQTAVDTFIKREATSFPWFDAYDRAYIEYGMDSSRLFVAGAPMLGYADKFPEGLVIRPTDPDIAREHEYVVIETKGTHLANNPEPVWDTAPGSESWYGGNVKYKERTPSVYPISTGLGSPYAGYDNHNWLAEMLNRSVEDPWFYVRAKGRIQGKDTGLAALDDPRPYDYATSPIANAGDYTVLANKVIAHYFQYQTYSNRPLYREVKVPRFDYDFWKAAALAGRGQKGVYYLQWNDTAKKYSNGLTLKTFEEWINEGPGFFFFETLNNMNPQNGGPGKLVPIDASPCNARGVVYMNVTSLKTTATGCNEVEGYYNQPGEPYRDVGYRKVNEVSVGMQIKKKFATDAAGNFVKELAYNNEWNWQDLEWSNGASAKNGIFDVCVAQRPMYRESTNTITNEWLPLPYFPDCNVGNNIQLPNCNCSEPFEPYLNLNYTGSKLNLAAAWEAPLDAASVHPKMTDTEKPTGTPVTCNPAAVASEDGQEDCVTNAWDKRGALAFLDKNANQAAVSIEGVLYNEGDYNSTGNTAYFGSVVVGGAVSPQGTQEIWYDACLAGDCWPPKHIPFPRVMVTSNQIQ